MTLLRRILLEKKRLVYPIVGALLINVAVFAAVVYPLSKRVAGGEQEAQAAAMSLAEARRDHAAAKATVSGKVSADEELKKFYGAVLPANQSDALHITYLRINQLARKADVMPVSYSADAKRERDSELGKLTATIVLSGDYPEIRRFIHDLETAPEFLVLENVALSQASSREGLDLTVQVATYYRAGANGN